MDTFSHYVGVSRDFVEFMGVAPRPGTLDEASGYNGNVDVYEVEIDRALKLKAVHAERQKDGDSDINVDLLYNGKAIFSQNLRCASIFVDKMRSGEVFLVLCQGSTNLHIHKNPWRLSVENSNYYQNTSDSDY